MRSRILPFAAILVTACAPAAIPPAVTPGTTAPAITASDLRVRVEAFAHDSMMGREAGTIYNQKGAEYIARELQRLGLQPAGENGTYFQYPVVRRDVDPNASISVGGRTFVVGRDFLPRDPTPIGIGAQRPFDGAQAVYGGVWGADSTLISPEQAAGKIVVITVPPLPNGQPGWQANRGAATLRYRDAAAIVIASYDAMPPEVRAQLGPGVTVRDAAGTAQRPAVAPAFLYATREMTAALLGGSPASMRIGTVGATVRGTIGWRDEAAPGPNVVAILPGSDAALRNQYVAIGAHNDHVGFLTPARLEHDSIRAFNRVVRPQGADNPNRPATASETTRIRSILDSLRALRPPRADSIFNGADDDASGSMAMLEVAEALATARAKPRRSILFVWHTAEEAGLFGADYYTENPTVPRDSIVAMINLDMIGRGGANDVQGGGPTYIQIIGSRRLSTEFGDLVEAVNRRRPQPFTFDYQYDRAGHPAQYYCRSDHYMYARFGIPVVFFSTGGHPDYHQVTDEPQYLDYEKLRSVSQLVHDIAVETATRANRPVVDQPKPDPRGQCRQ